MGTRSSDQHTEIVDFTLNLYFIYEKRGGEENREYLKEFNEVITDYFPVYPTSSFEGHIGAISQFGLFLFLTLIS